MNQQVELESSILSHPCVFSRENDPYVLDLQLILDSWDDTFATEVTGARRNIIPALWYGQRLEFEGKCFKAERRLSNVKSDQIRMSLSFSQFT